jgi:hypothetical protein
MAQKRKTATSKARRSGGKSHARSKAKPAVALRGAASGVAADMTVTMAISFPSGNPGDVISTKRIDGRTLPASGKTTVITGKHTAGWDVISPTIKPLDFAVTITPAATGKKLLDRSREKTGSDGRGAGADKFEI